MNRIDQWIRSIGKACSWAILLMAVITTLIVIARKGFNLNSVAIQELVTYLHATVFMLAIPWALQVDEHVRVDIFYRKMAANQKHWVNVVGGIVCLVPYCAFVVISSEEFVFNAWKITEGSAQANGLDGVFILKTLIPISFFLLAVQGLSIIFQGVRNILKESN